MKKEKAQSRNRASTPEKTPRKGPRSGAIVYGELGTIQEIALKELESMWSQGDLDRSVGYPPPSPSPSPGY